MAAVAVVVVAAAVAQVVPGALDRDGLAGWTMFAGRSVRAVAKKSWSGEVWAW